MTRNVSISLSWSVQMHESLWLYVVYSPSVCLLYSCVYLVTVNLFTVSHRLVCVRITSLWTQSWLTHLRACCSEGKNSGPQKFSLSQWLTPVSRIYIRWVRFLRVGSWDEERSRSKSCNLFEIKLWMPASCGLTHHYQPNKLMGMLHNCTTATYTTITVFEYCANTILLCVSSW